MKAIAVIPAFNEEKRIGSVIRETKRHVDKVIVIDDGSTDKTAEVSRRFGAQVIRYEKNRGVGFVTKIGLEKAISLKPKVIVFLDADGQHDPRYIPYFLNAIKNGADYVCGKRDLSKYPFNRKIGNWGLKVLTNLLCPTGIMDTECGFRALSLDAAKKIDLKAKNYGERYGREMAFAYNVWKNKFKIKQVRIEVHSYHSKTAISRGFKNFFYLIKIRLEG